MNRLEDQMGLETRAHEQRGEQLSKHRTPTPQDLGRMALESAGGDIERAKNGLMRMLRKSPELVAGIMWWAIETAMSDVLRQLVMARNPSRSFTGSREVVAAVPTHTSVPNLRVARDTTSHATATHAHATKAGEAEMARKQRLTESHPALAAPKIKDWYDLHRLYGQKIRLGDATAEQLMFSAAQHKRQADGQLRTVRFETEIAGRVAKGKRVKQCLTNAQIQEIRRQCE